MNNELDGTPIPTDLLNWLITLPEPQRTKETLIAKKNLNILSTYIKDTSV